MPAVLALAGIASGGFISEGSGGKLDIHFLNGNFRGWDAGFHGLETGNHAPFNDGCHALFLPC